MTILSAASTTAAPLSDLALVSTGDFLAELQRRVGAKEFGVTDLDFVTLSQGQLLADFKTTYQGNVYSAESLAFLDRVFEGGVEDDAALENARDWWRRGDRREALHYLEIALGNDFHGLEGILK